MRSIQTLRVAVIVSWCFVLTGVTVFAGYVAPGPGLYCTNACKTKSMFKAGNGYLVFGEDVCNPCVAAGCLGGGSNWEDCTDHSYKTSVEVWTEGQLACPQQTDGEITTFNGIQTGTFLFTVSKCYAE
jgi:hypothetical protein